ncbi:tudor domain-containing protein [Ferruginibacter sp.]
MSNTRYKILAYALWLLLPVTAVAQTVGTKVAVLGVDGKTYTGVVQQVNGNWYTIKYDRYNYTAQLTKNQFTITDNNQGGPPTNNLVGARVSITGTNGVVYTGVVKEVNGSRYRVKYDGYGNEEWLSATQFSVINNSTTVNTNTPITSNTGAAPANVSADMSGLKAIFEFGHQKGWAQQPHVNKFNAFANKLSAEEAKKVVTFLQQATTASARFFALKSLLTGDSYPVVQKFIEQLNQHPEAYQQENCLATTHRSIIQQWEYSCSVTAVQTYLADLSPRYAWEVKQIVDYDKADNNPHNPMAEQQKELLEKYGGGASPRGNYSGKAIGITTALNELVGPILGVRYTAVQVTEPLPVIFGKVRSLIDRGIDVPLLIGFAGTQVRHFILTMRYRQTANGYQYLIYDPWDGVCDYVNESGILQGSLSPLLTQWKITIDYYYPVQ